jgi:hypothetical protein
VLPRRRFDSWCRSYVRSTGQLSLPKKISAIDLGGIANNFENGISTISTAVRTEGRADDTFAAAQVSNQCGWIGPPMTSETAWREIFSPTCAIAAPIAVDLILSPTDYKGGAGVLVLRVSILKQRQAQRQGHSHYAGPIQSTHCALPCGSRSQLEPTNKAIDCLTRDV